MSELHRRIYSFKANMTFFMSLLEIFQPVVVFIVLYILLLPDEQNKFSLTCSQIF